MVEPMVPAPPQTRTVAPLNAVIEILIELQIILPVVNAGSASVSRR